MSISLGLRTLAVLALVAASTVLIVKSDLAGGASATRQNTINPAAPWGRN